MATSKPTISEKNAARMVRGENWRNRIFSKTSFKKMMSRSYENCSSVTRRFWVQERLVRDDRHSTPSQPCTFRTAKAVVFGFLFAGSKDIGPRFRATSAERYESTMHGHARDRIGEWQPQRY